MVYLKLLFLHLLLLYSDLIFFTKLDFFFLTCLLQTAAYFGGVILM